MILAQDSTESANGDGARADVPSPGSGDRSHAGAEVGTHDPGARHGRPVDPAALQILNEEAERELSLRRAQASGSGKRPAGKVQPASGDAAPGKRSHASARKSPVRGREGWLRAVPLLVFMMAALVGLLIAIYLRAPAISQTYPNTEGPLQSYLEAANAFLGWLNGALGRQ